MAFNPYIGWTQAQLETELRSAQEELARGAAIVSAGAGDVSSSFQVQSSVERRIELLYRALYLLAPLTYPLASITRRDRTTPAYW